MDVNVANKANERSITMMERITNKLKNPKWWVGQATGASSIKGATSDTIYNLRCAGSIFKEAINQIKSSLTVTQGEKINWQEEPSVLFDMFCKKDKITTKGVILDYKKRYFTGWISIAFIFALYIVALKNTEHGVPLIAWQNIYCAALAFGVSFGQEYRMHMLREQRIITIQRFLLIYIRSPGIWIPQRLKKTYKIRIEGN